MPLGGLGGGGGVKGPHSNNMPRAPRNVNPALRWVKFRCIGTLNESIS